MASELCWRPTCFEAIFYPYTDPCRQETFHAVYCFHLCLYRRLMAHLPSTAHATFKQVQINLKSTALRL